MWHHQRAGPVHTPSLEGKREAAARSFRGKGMGRLRHPTVNENASSPVTPDQQQEELAL